MKTCRKCSTSKPLSDFWADKHRKDGKQTACSSCQRRISKAFRDRHPGYHSIKGRERYAAVGKTQNRQRYNASRDAFLAARKGCSESLRGRLMSLIRSAKNRAVKRSLPFEIDLAFVADLWDKQGGCCAITGLPMTLSTNIDGNRKYMPFSPSLDQRVAGGGYTIGNTRLVCCIVNIALNHFGDENFATMCRAFVNQHGHTTEK